MNEAVLFCVVKHRIADFIFHNTQILMEKKAYFSFCRGGIFYYHFPQINIFLKINYIVTDELKAQLFMAEEHRGHQRFIEIPQRNIPFIGSNPRKTFLCPYPKPAWITPGMVFLSNVREVKIPNRIA